MDIIIFSGQSNIHGQTEGLPNENPIVDGALEYRYLTDEFVPLQHPVGEDVKFEKWIACAADWGAGTAQEKRGWDEAIMSAQERAAKEDEDFVILTRICTKLSQRPECINTQVAGHYNNAAMKLIGTEAGQALAKISEKERRS